MKVLLWLLVAGCLSRTIHSFTMNPAPQRHLLGVTVMTPKPLFAADAQDDDDTADHTEDPLSDGVDSVSWLPSVKETTTSETSGKSIPLFPLGGIVYTPNSEHVLNIFEPRYRQMYTDILMNGSKRFAVSMSHPTESGTFASYAVLFELEDLREVSAQTDDQIKYICNHKVTGRVKLSKILNPEAWETRETYLKAEGVVIDDSGKDGTTEEEQPELQKKLRDAFADLVELQHELEEDVRFTRASVLSLAVMPGAGEKCLWETIKLWQSFVDQRLMARQNELQKDFQKRLQEFLKSSKGFSEEDLPSAIGFQDLSPELQNEVIELQKRMAVELQPLVLESTLTMQKLLECQDHSERLELLQYFVTSETRRLTTKKTLQGMFSTSAGSDSDTLITTTTTTSTSTTTAAEEDDTAFESSKADEVPAESLPEDEEEEEEATDKPSFFSDDNAFQ